MQISPDRLGQAEGRRKHFWKRFSYLSLVVNLELLDFARQMQQPPIDRYTRGRWKEDIAMGRKKTSGEQRRISGFCF